MGLDRISALPESLLTHILAYLPIRDSIKTSVLSTRWKFLWLIVSGLDLKDRDFPPCEKLFERFMEFNRESRMQKLKIQYHYNKRAVEWIATAIDRGIQELHVQTEMPLNAIDFMPVIIFKSKTLVSLKLADVGLVKPGEFLVSLPCLKIMYLENVYYRGDGSLIMEKLIISGSPVLEDLTVVRNFFYYNHPDSQLPLLHVRSQTLKIFRSMCISSIASPIYTVKIDAPGLKYMTVSDNQPDRIVVKNLSSLFKIDIDIDFKVPKDFRKIDIFCDLLTGISSIRHMIISQSTLEAISLFQTGIGSQIP